jgi:hypothetical protein
MKKTSWYKIGNLVLRKHNRSGHSPWVGSRSRWAGGSLSHSTLSHSGKVPGSSTGPPPTHTQLCHRSCSKQQQSFEALAVWEKGCKTQKTSFRRTTNPKNEMQRIGRYRENMNPRVDSRIIARIWREGAKMAHSIFALDPTILYSLNRPLSTKEHFFVCLLLASVTSS